MRLAVALAFADASIVVLALPEIVDRLHTSITHVAWVIMAYNLALIVASAILIPVARWLPARPALVAGLALFGLASIGCGASGTLSTLIPLRCLQGAAGALVLAASLPLFAASARPGDSPLRSWSAAAAIGAAVGPAAGGVLTQLFDWRSIFIAQAPVAAFAAVAVLVAGARRGSTPTRELERAPTALGALSANLALALLSAGIIGALFLVVIELINAWLLTPIAAAAIVTVIPLATAAAERFVRARSAVVLGATGAALVVTGLVILALLNQRELGWVVIALTLCGAGLGLAYPGLTAAALESRGAAAARAAKTVAARDAGLVLGLLVLTPVFAHQVTAVANDRGPVDEAALVVIEAPLPLATKVKLGTRLVKVYKSSGQANVPNIAPAFADVRAGVSAPVAAHLDELQATLNQIVQAAVTPAFRRPYLYAAILAALVFPVLGLRLAFGRRRGTGPSPRTPAPIAAP